MTNKTPATLALSDGKIFRGYCLGEPATTQNPCVGEVVFNTSMYGYQEILSDPSYTGQIMTFTYPHIGNVGCNDEDEESNKLYVEGIIIRDASKVVSNFRAKRSLNDHLANHKKMGLYGIDTRELVTHIRTHGAKMGAMAAGDNINADLLVDRAKSNGSMLGKDYVQHVSCEKPYAWSQLPWKLGTGYTNRNASSEKQLPHVVAVDCGIKHNILRLLAGSGLRVTVVPYNYSASQIKALNPNGVFLSNGPGDPATLGYIVSTVKELLGNVPIFGICLGHQLLSQAIGGATYKMPFGHRGGNHPVKDIKTGVVEITVQNHGFAVDPSSLSKDALVRHVNLNDNTVEGLEIESAKAFSIQYHPESSPGPHDSQIHFKRFFDLIAAS